MPVLNSLILVKMFLVLNHVLVAVVQAVRIRDHELVVNLCRCQLGAVCWILGSLEHFIKVFEFLCKKWLCPGGMRCSVSICKVCLWSRHIELLPALYIFIFIIFVCLLRWIFVFGSKLYNVVSWQEFVILFISLIIQLLISVINLLMTSDLFSNIIEKWVEHIDHIWIIILGQFIVNTIQF